ncbi:MAG TPA: lysoplasmalogenase family protein [Aggregatilineaceae bacterium]|nr:lysoplasmalogenase family protein [Aggregatilineaceae bacterium]
MNLSLIPIPVNLILIAMYLVARNRNDLKRTAYIQPLTTLLSIAVAGLSLINPQTNPSYTVWILVGLGLCFAADIFNIDMNNDKIFLAGILFFLVAYSIYAVVFTVFNQGFHSPDILVGILFLLIYLLLMRLYWKKLGKYRLPVMIYGLFLPFMVTRAISTLWGGVFPLTAAVLVTAGSLLLFGGDVEYGMHRFYKPGTFTVGPICYAGGQLLIALSCAYFLV